MIYFALSSHNIICLNIIASHDEFRRTIGGSCRRAQTLQLFIPVVWDFGCFHIFHDYNINCTYLVSRKYVILHELSLMRLVYLKFCNSILTDFNTKTGLFK